MCDGADDSGGADGFGVSDFGGFATPADAQAAAAGQGDTGQSDVDFGIVGPSEEAFTSQAIAEAQAQQAAATASAQASGSSVGGPAGAAGAFDPSLGLGIPGVDPQAQTLDQAIAAQEADPETFGLPDPGLFNDPITGNPVSAAELAARAGFTGLSMAFAAPLALGIPGALGTLANAFGAQPGTDTDAFGAAVGDVGAGQDAGGSQGVGGQANFDPAGVAGFVPTGSPLTPQQALHTFIPRVDPLSAAFAPPGTASPASAIPPLPEFAAIPADQLAAFQARLNRFGV